MNDVNHTLAREVAKQVPALLVNAFIVWMFLGYMGSMNDRVVQMIEELRTGCHRVQERSIKVMDETQQRLGEWSETNRDVADALRALNK